MAQDYLDKNIGEVREKIHRAKELAGRTDEVILIAAVKSGEVEEINRLHDRLGVAHIGENRVQQLLSRYELYHREGLTIHFIGHLQTNKVKYIIDKVDMIHSLDSERLAAEIDRRAGEHGICMKVLIEINIGREPDKSGVLPEEVPTLFRAVCALPNIRVCGFMTMAPICESRSQYREYFREAARIGRQVWHDAQMSGEPMLSMGMSGSFEAAIAEGATAVRVGRRLFEKTI